MSMLSGYEHLQARLACGFLVSCVAFPSRSIVSSSHRLPFCPRISDFSVARVTRYRSRLLPTKELGWQQVDFMAGQTNAAIASSQDSSPESEDVSAESIIFEPTKKGDTDVLLVFVPGALINATLYAPLLQRIQAQAELQLWIAVLDHASKNLTPSLIDTTLTGILSRVKASGFCPGELPTSNIFIGGHSWGAWQSRAVALKRSQGFIQMGSCFHSNPDNLAQYPKPVLTLSGELDGQITLQSLVKHAAEIAEVEEELTTFNTYAFKPVVIISGMNHAQLADGKTNYGRGDLSAEISLEEAHQEVAKVVAAFLTVHVQPSTPDVRQKELQILTVAVQDVHMKYKAFWEAMEKQGHEAKELQVELASTPRVTVDKVKVTRHDFLDNFVYSKPWIEESIYLHVYLNSADKFHLIKNIWVKLKSREAVLKEFGDDSEDLGIMSCSVAAARHFNEKTYSKALDLVPEASRTKFLAKGKKLRFLDDVEFKSGVDWVASDLTMKPATDGSGYVDVQSPVLTTPSTGVASRFAGMHYMKLLSVPRAMAWICQGSFA